VFFSNVFVKRRRIKVNKRAKTRFPIHDLLARRWSPRTFSKRNVTPESLGSLFEAARWSASCYNEQPWRFIVARRERDDEYNRLLGCLVEGNRAWANQAAVLVLGLAKKSFSHNGKTNAHARHDLGLATAQIMAQAMALDLYVHAMAGILPDKARKEYRIPEEFDVVTGLAIGYLSDADGRQEQKPRERRPLRELVFSGLWEESADFTS
jgi:nitroreductase